MKEIIAPRILPANFSSGRGPHTFELYYPLVAARQLGFGEVPPQPYFAYKVQTRDAIKNGLTYNRLKMLEPDTSTIQFANLQIMPFTTVPFVQWWSEWQDHIFCESVGSYCIILDEDYEGDDDAVCIITIPLDLSTHNIFLLYF